MNFKREYNVVAYGSNYIIGLLFFIQNTMFRVESVSAQGGVWSKPISENDDRSLDLSVDATTHYVNQYS